MLTEQSACDYEESKFLNYYFFHFNAIKNACQTFIDV